jgi:hypothetical protein
MDVPQEPPVAIDPIERRVGLKRDVTTNWHQADERRPGRTRVALARSKLGCVDLEQANALSAPERQRVAVVHRGDNPGSERRTRGGLTNASTADERHGDGRNCGGHKKHDPLQLISPLTDVQTRKAYGASPRSGPAESRVASHSRS